MKKRVTVTSKKLESALGRLNNLTDSMGLESYRIVREIGQAKYSLTGPTEADLERSQYLNVQQAYYFLCGAFNALAAAYREEKKDHKEAS